MIKNNSSLTNIHHDKYPLLYKSKKTAALFLALVNCTRISIQSLLRIIKPFKIVKMYLIKSDRIGRLAYDNDMLLRRLQLGILKKQGICYVGLGDNDVANKQLMKMFKRELPILQFPFPRTLSHYTLLAVLDPDHNLYDIHESILGQKFPYHSISNSIFYQPSCYGTDPPNDYYEFTNAKPNLQFTKKEEKMGKKLLQEMGIGEKDWFICFHSRSSSFVNKEFIHMTDQQQDFRNCDIDNYLKAAKYITDCGGFAIRMGIHTKPLPNHNNPRIIDYAAHHRSDFGDIYLPAKCKFFLGNTAGLFIVSSIFNVPIAATNFIPFHTPYSKNDLFIPKKLLSNKKQRFLTLKEQLEFENKVDIWNNLSNAYIRKGFVPTQNTSEEILDLTKEMNERIDGTYKYTDEEEELQKRFQSLLKPHYPYYNTPARLGAEFLKKNRDLLK